MPEQIVPAHAQNERRFTIPPGANETALDVVLPNNKQPGNYKVVKKDVPAAAQGKQFRGKPVKWINNFGVRLKGRFRTKRNTDEDDPFIEDVEGQSFDYDVVVPGPAPEGYSSVVYFDGNDVQLGAAALDSDGFYRFSINIGDPPTGWGG